MGAREVPGGVDGLIAVPFDDKRHQAEIEGAKRRREQETPDIAVSEFDGAAWLKDCDCDERQHDLLDGDLRAESQVAEAWVDRQHPVDCCQAHRDSVKDERERCAEKAEPSGRDQRANRRPPKKRDEAASREGGDVEIEARHVRRGERAAVRPGIEDVQAREQEHEEDRQEER